MEAVAGCWERMTRFRLQLAADRGRNASRNGPLRGFLCYDGSDSADRVQVSKDECRQQRGEVDEEDKGIRGELPCYVLLTVCCCLITFTHLGQ